MIEPINKRPITHQVPEHLVEAFLQTTSEFFQNAHGGTTTAQRAAELRAADRDAGLDALASLVDFTRGHTGQCGIVARFLAGLYNGTDFPFDLTELRAFDADLFEQCLAVLRLDNQPAVEIHKYIPDGDAVFLKMLQDWNLVKRPAPPPPPGDHFHVTYATHGNAPGYRGVTLHVRFEGAAASVAPTELTFNAADSDSLAQDLLGIHRFVWEDGREPIDKQPGEQRPRWIAR